jgi:hypothetical protein
MSLPRCAHRQGQSRLCPNFIGASRLSPSTPVRAPPKVLRMRSAAARVRSRPNHLKISLLVKSLGCPPRARAESYLLLAGSIHRARPVGCPRPPHGRTLLRQRGNPAPASSGAGPSPQTARTPSHDGPPAPAVGRCILKVTGLEPRDSPSTFDRNRRQQIPPDRAPQTPLASGIDDSRNRSDDAAIFGEYQLVFGFEEAAADNVPLRCGLGFRV